MRSIITSLLLFLGVSLAAHAQINPAQIKWPTGAAGCVYAPGSNTCVTVVPGSGIPACSDTSGSGTAQNCTTSPTFTPSANSCVIYTTTTTNSGAGLTTDINSLGVKSVAIPGASGWTTTLTASILPTGKPLMLCYDGTNWNVVQTGTQTGGSSSFQYSVLPVPPSLSGFTDVNWQTGTLATQGAAGAINFAIAYNGSLNWQLLTASVPSTPWSVQGFFRQIQDENKSATWPSYYDTSTAGLYLYDGTKLEGIEDLDSNSAGYGVRVERITNVTTDDATEYGPNPLYTAISQSGYYKRWCDNGTTLYAEVSQDGQNWGVVWSEPVGTFITPNAIAIGGAVSAQPGLVEELNLQGWQVTSGATCP